MKKLIIIFFILLFAPSAQAASHYVTEAGAGTYSGSAIGNAFSAANFNNTSNWATTPTAGKISPGDTVYFSGDFSTRLTILMGGNATDGAITFDGYEAGSCDPVTEACSSSARLLQGLEVGNGTHGPDYLTIQDLRMTRTSSTNPGFRIYGPSGNSIDHVIVRRNLVYNTYGTMFYYYRGQYVVVEDNKFTHFGQGSTDATQGVNLIEIYNAVIRENEMGHDEDTYPSGCTSAEMLELHGCKNLLIEKNNIYGAPNQVGIRPKEHASKMENIVIRYNRVYDNANLTSGSGINIHTRSDQPISDFYVYGNYVHGNGTHGILVGTGVTNAHIWGNLVTDNGRGGVVSWKTDANSSYINIYNNTLARNSTRAETDITRGGIILTAGDNISIKNNLLWNNRPGGETYRGQIANYRTITLEHNSYYHASGAPYIYHSSGWRTLATMQTTYSKEDDSPAGVIEDPVFTNPDGTDTTYGTTDDDYTLSSGSPCIDTGAVLNTQFSVNLSNSDSWFETNSGYSTLTFGFDNLLDPHNTDWATTIPTAATVKVSGDHPRGAYAYYVEEEEEPPGEPPGGSTYSFDPRDGVVDSDPVDSDEISMKNLWVSDIEVSAIDKVLTPIGYQAWRLNNFSSGGRVIYLDDIPAESYQFETLILYRPSHSVNAQVWPGGRLGAIASAAAGYFGGVRTSTGARLSKAVSGSFSTLLYPDHDLAAVTDTWLWAKTTMIEDDITVSIWPYGGTEPVSPQISVTDATIATGTGGAYLWLSNATIDIAWIGVGTEGSSAPTPTSEIGIYSIMGLSPTTVMGFSPASIMGF